MKKIFFPLLFLLAAAMQSCSDGLDRHGLSVVYPVGYTSFADNTQDSLVFLTFDSWQVHPDDSWITVVGKSSDEIRYDYYKNYLIHVDLALEANTTGKTRVGRVTVKSYEYEGSGLYVQFPFLNVSHPAPDLSNYENNEYGLPMGADFVLTDSDYVVRDSLCFQVQKDWNLAFAPDADQSWLQVSETSGSQGENVVQLSMEKNSAPEDRRTRLVLTSSGVSTEISLVQLGHPQK